MDVRRVWSSGELGGGRLAIPAGCELVSHTLGDAESWAPPPQQIMTCNLARSWDSKNDTNRSSQMLGDF